MHILLYNEVYAQYVLTTRILCKLLSDIKLPNKIITVLLNNIEEFSINIIRSTKIFDGKQFT